MKLFANKKIFKKIVIMLVIIMMITTLMPLHQVSADSDEDFAGALFRPICQFFAGVGDLFIGALQWIFIGDGEIKINIIEEFDEMSTYVIRYSPGIIFSNNVPGLDANFINPGDPKKVTKLNGNARRLTGPDLLHAPTSKKLTVRGEDNAYKSGFWIDDPNETANDLRRYGFDENKVDYFTYDDWEFYRWDAFENTYYAGRNMYDSAGNKNNGTFGLWEVTTTTIDETDEEKVSIAEELQVTIVTWYKALRLVSLVALLSVLVYVGIRIIISSTGQEKAKYKKMIGDWLAAVCILFVLNYIMAFTMEIVSQVTNIFSAGFIGPDGVDTLMSGIRSNIMSDKYSSVTTFTYLILYLVLVVYTVLFTVHYLKRVVYLAFFTMIAPLIAVTYPIDKIKDGQAQAFGTWIKEYTFNAAIPVIHIIIYSVLVWSASDLAAKNPLYAIVAISFLIPAEKFFKKLFGFDKASTVSQLGAAAGGALVMNAINKMGQKSGRQAAAKAGEAGGNMPRMNRTGYIAAPGAPMGGSVGGNTGTLNGGQTAGTAGGQTTSQTGSTAGSQTTGQTGSTAGGQTTGQTGSTAGGQTTGQTGSTAGGSGGSATGGLIGTTFGQTINSGLPRPKAIKGANKKGWGGVARRYFNKANTVKALKAGGRILRRGVVGLPVAGLGATAGLAIGISTGDLSNAFKYGAGGAFAGYKAANYVGDTVTKGFTAVKNNASNDKNAFQENKWGTDEYNTRKQIKELSNDKEFNKTARTLGLDKKGKEELIRKFNSNGITDSGDILNAMNIQAKNNVSQDEVIAVQKIRMQAKRQDLKRKDVIASLRSQGLGNADITRAMDLYDKF